MQYKYDRVQPLGALSLAAADEWIDAEPLQLPVAPLEASEIAPEPDLTSQRERNEEDGSAGRTSQDVEQFISLGDEPGEQQRTRTPSGPDAEEPSTSGRREVVWGGAMHRIKSPLLRLHNEIVDFCRCMAPSEREAEERRGALSRVTEAVLAIWPSASVKVFGSFVTGLYLPTSDMDFVVMDSNCGDIRSALKAVATSLVRKNIAKNIQIIAKAKVPIIKFEERVTGVNFDISFDASNGPQAAENVKALMSRLPAMRPLILVLKVFLQQRELNEVYQGGVGSYALLVMVASFLLLHPSRARQDEDLEANLGVLLLDFLRLFGRSLNVNEVGISCRKGGAYVRKRSRGMLQPERPYMLAVEDPNDPDNDLGKGSYNIQKVRSAFDFAYQQLTTAAEGDNSLLQRIIRLDDILTERPLPESPEPGPEAKRAAWPVRGQNRTQEDPAASHHASKHKQHKEQRRKKRRKDKGGHGRWDEGEVPRSSSREQSVHSSKRKKRSHSSVRQSHRDRHERKKAKRVRERDAAFASAESGELID